MVRFPIRMSENLLRVLEEAARKQREKRGSGRASVNALIVEALEKRYLVPTRKKAA